MKKRPAKSLRLPISVLLVFLGLVFQYRAQKLESVEIGGTRYYVYPYPMEAYPSMIFMKALNEEDFKYLSQQDIPEFEQQLMIYNMEMASAKKLSKKQARPIRQHAERFYSMNYNTESDMVPALDKLPDGKYIQYFDRYMKFDANDRPVIESRKIAGYFTLKNNLPEGDALWLSMTGDSAKYGKFVNGQKEGLWTCASLNLDGSYSPAFIASYLAKKPVYNIEKSTFSNGIQNGPCESWSDGLLLQKGHYIDGKPAGEWHVYSVAAFKSNGVWKDTTYLSTHYTLAGSDIVSHKPYIRSNFLDGNMPSKYFTFPNYFGPISFDNFWKLNLQEDPDFELPEEELTSYDGEMYDQYAEELAYMGDYGIDGDMMWIGDKYMKKSRLIDSLGLINEYSGVYEEFWENGQLKICLNYDNGDLVEEDTIFWDNGKPADVVIYDPVKKQYENRKMDYTGTLYEVNVYDSLGGFLVQTLDPYYSEKHVRIEGVDASLQEDYIFIDDGKSNFISSEWNTYAYDNTDTLENPALQGQVLLKKTWYPDSSALQSTVYNTAERSVTEEMRSIDGTLISSSVSEYDETFEKVRGTSVQKLKDLELYTTFNGNYQPMFNLGMEDSVKAMRTQSSFLYEMTSESILKYKDAPYTGKISVNLMAKAPAYSISKNNISIGITENVKFLKALSKDYKKWRATGKARYQDVFSSATIINKQYSDHLTDVFPDLSFMITGNMNTYDQNILKVPYKKIEGSFLNGKPNGTWRTYDAKGKVMIEITYLNGEMNGTIKLYSYAKPAKKASKVTDDNYYMEYNPFETFDTLPPKPLYYLNTSISTKNGILSGDYLTYNWQGKVKTRSNYVNGYPEGPAEEHNAIASTYTNYENGVLDGIVRTYLHLPQSDTILLYELNFQDGVLQGESRSYHTNGKLSKRGFFASGQPIDDYEAYDSLGTRFHYVKFQYSFPVEEKIWEANQLSVRYQFDWRDSIYFRPDDITQAASVDNLLYEYGLMGSEYSQPYYGRPSLVEKAGINYHMTKYFPNDSVSRDGALSAGKKTGCWQFFSYEGEKLYEVEYFDTILKLNDTVQFKSKGILYDYNAKGDLLSKSYIIEKFEKYDCSHTDHYEIRQFYTFWQAHDSLHRINGYVKNYYDNGVLQSEGNMKDGLPTGVWKYYDPFGNLNHAGEYKLGKRDGRWLSGDLSKSKYLGDICMNPNLPNLEEKMKYQEKLLDIYIRHFKMGKLLNSEYYDLNLNNYEEENPEDGLPDE